MVLPILTFRVQGEQIAIEAQLQIGGGDAGHFGNQKEIAIFLKQIAHGLAHLVNDHMAGGAVLLHVAKRFDVDIVSAESELDADAIDTPCFAAGMGCRFRADGTVGFPLHAREFLN